MDAMHARTWRSLLASLLLVGASLATVACVPNPAAPGQSGTGGGIPSPSVTTPEPTLAASIEKEEKWARESVAYARSLIPGGAATAARAGEVSAP